MQEFSTLFLLIILKSNVLIILYGTGNILTLSMEALIILLFWLDILHLLISMPCFMLGVQSWPRRRSCSQCDWEDRQVIWRPRRWRGWREAGADASGLSEDALALTRRAEHGTSHKTWVTEHRKTAKNNVLDKESACFTLQGERT